MVGGVDRCVGRRRGRVEADVRRKRGDAAELASRPEPLEAPDVPAIVATAATARTATAAATAHERFIRPDRSTVHCRGSRDQLLGSPAPGMRLSGARPGCRQRSLDDPV